VFQQCALWIFGRKEGGKEGGACVRVLGIFTSFAKHNGKVLSFEILDIYKIASGKVSVPYSQG